MTTLFLSTALGTEAVTPARIAEIERSQLRAGEQYGPTPVARALATVASMKHQQQQSSLLAAPVPQKALIPMSSTKTPSYPSEPPSEKVVPILTPTEREVAQKMGMSVEEYAEEKKKYLRDLKERRERDAYHG